MNHSPAQLYLASQSPRRAELLEQIGIQFETLNISLPELKRDHESAEDFVLRLANEKAIAGLDLREFDHVPVLGADTIVYCDGKILGKPRNEQHAKEMLQLLSANTHTVMTAVAVATLEQSEVSLNISRISMRKIESKEIDSYVQTGEPMDKAGSYAVQGQAAVFIEEIKGSYSGIMGLPLFETARILNCFGISSL